jgi:hypothetical protein
MSGGPSNGGTGVPNKENNLSKKAGLETSNLSTASGASHH